jgi:hypothetical protein
MVVVSDGAYRSDLDGYAPLDCNNDSRTDIVFLWNAKTWAGDRPISGAKLAAHELGHSFGLTHVTDTADLMIRSGISQSVSYRTSPLLIDGYHQHCVSGTTQDGPAVLVANVGARRLASAPVAISWAPNRYDVFQTGPNGDVLHRYNTNGTWSRWESLLGDTVHAPAVASWEPGRLDVFITARDGRLMHRSFANGTWSSGWNDLGGSLKGAPTAVSWSPGRIDVFGRGAYDDLVQRFYNGQWSNWGSLGGILTSNPSAASWGSGNLTVYVRGTDNGLHYRGFNSSSGWSGWVALGGTATSAPAAVSPAPGLIHVFVQSTDSKMWSRIFNGLNWSNWYQVPMSGTTAPGVAPSASGWNHGSYSNSHVNLWVRGTDDNLFVAGADYGYPWSSWVLVY